MTKKQADEKVEQYALEYAQKHAKGVDMETIKAEIKRGISLRPKGMTQESLKEQGYSLAQLILFVHSN